MDFSPLATFILGFGLAALMTFVIGRVAKSRKWVAQQDFRRPNHTPIPLLGGVGVAIGFVTAATQGFTETSALSALIFLIPAFAVGVLDDFKELDARWKLIGQGLSVAMWIHMTPTDALILSQLGWPGAIATAVSAIWMLGIMNAVNMIDGSDGVAAGFGIVAAFAMAMLWSVGAQDLWLVAFSGALAGFLVWNFPPAQIYLGDSGSQLIGLFLASQALTLQLPEPRWTYLLIPLFIFAHPQVDAILSIHRRIKAGSQPWKGDHDHIHHKLKKLGLSVTRTWILIMAISIYAATAAWFIALEGATPTSAYIAVATTLALMVPLASVYLLESVIVQKFSLFSKGFMHTYIPLVEEIHLNSSPTRIVSYDLFPYYQELQMRGILEVQNFVRSFRSHLERVHVGNSQYLLHGSYTVLVIETVPERGHWKSETEVIDQFFALLDRERVRKNVGASAWGLKFYSAETRDQMLKILNRFDLQNRVAAPSEVKRAS